MHIARRRPWLLVMYCALLCGARLWAAQWAVLGPDGGDVRSLSYDPRNPDRIFLGTNTGTIFLSSDGGRNWSRFAHLGNGDSFVLDHIAFLPNNPEVMYVSAWSVEDRHAGGLFRSQDSGTTWESLPGMYQKSVRTMAISPSDSNVIAVGALDGVYLSRDGGDKWEHISGSNQTEIKNIESVVIDPKNANAIYAGTWHLAWKTNDAGASWHRINKGMIDDSDVFSIIVDSSNPMVVFVSACSGIYKSETAGELFQKVQGIPFSSRRTRVLRQDPSDPKVVYAGTTEGLWRTADGGKTWKRVSNSEIVINDVLVDPRNSKRLLLATDRSGVVASNDGAQTFTPSNHGFTHRFVSSIVADRNDANKIFVGLVNDREWGGVFSYRHGGEHWQQNSSGLGGRDVFTLKQTSTGELIAGTSRGIFMLTSEGQGWRPINSLGTDGEGPQTARKAQKKITAEKRSSFGSELNERVNELDVTSTQWLAATSAGLFVSSNQGASWRGGALMGEREFVSVQANGPLQVAATRTKVLFSRDGGGKWQLSNLGSLLTSIRGVTVTPEAHILVASREGAFASFDSGTTWQRMAGLPVDISSITYDQSGQRLLATSLAVSVVFESNDGGRNWRAGPDSGYPLRRITLLRGRYVAATPFDGLIVEPENEPSEGSSIITGTWK